MSRRRALPVLLALLLAFQWSATLAHCLAMLGAPAAHAVEICGADGVRTLLLDAEGNPAEPAAPHPTCAMAGAAPEAALPVPAAPLPRPVAWHPAPTPPAPAGLPPFPPRAPPQQPRAPPAA